MSKTEYLPVLVCRPASVCVKRNDAPHEHVLSVPNRTFTTEISALDHAAGMKHLVYGAEHDVKMLARTVSEWVVL